MNEEESLIRVFFRYKKHLIIPTMIIVLVVGGIINWLSIDYFCFKLIPNVWNWGFEPIVWWKAILSFFADFYLGGIALIVFSLFLFLPFVVLFQIYIEDIEKYHYRKYLKTIHYPYPELYIFLSHKSEYKEEVLKVSNELSEYGIKCFVAHENIEATKEWEDEIIQALRSMDMLVALMTKKFKESDWTSQEIGFALGKNVPIISVNLGDAPYGFIGRKQAISTNWNSVSKSIIDVLLKEFMNIDKVIDIYILKMSKCQNFKEGDILESYISSVKSLTKKQIESIIQVYNENSQLYGRYKFRDDLDNNKYINQFNKILGKQTYQLNPKTFKIEQVS